MIVHNKPFEAFADGLVTVYSVVNIAEEGDRPRDGLRKLLSLPFDYKTVGLNRYVQGRQEDVEISEMVSVPCVSNISTQNIVVINNIQYKIWQMQRVNDTRPNTLKLSLKKVVENYEVEITEL